MSESERRDVKPWSARRPQNLVLSALLIVLAVALVWQGVTFIKNGTGGLVPYFIILGGPALAVNYVWYFTIRRFEPDEPAA